MRSILLLLLIILTSLFFHSLDSMSKEVVKMGELRLSSPAFTNNGYIPSKYTCDGKDINPPLVIEGIPEGTKSLALIVDDPDAPMGTWVHWVVWDIAPNIQRIEEDTVPEGARQGINDFRRHDYGGPCPPLGTHRYFFKLYALNRILDLPDNTRKADLERAMKGHILSHTHIIGLYQRR